MALRKFDMNKLAACAASDSAHFLKLSGMLMRGWEAEHLVSLLKKKKNQRSSSVIVTVYNGMEKAGVSTYHSWDHKALWEMGQESRRHRPGVLLSLKHKPWLRETTILLYFHAIALSRVVPCWHL